MTRGWLEAFFDFLHHLRKDPIWWIFSKWVVQPPTWSDVGFTFWTWSLIETNEYPSFTYQKEMPRRSFLHFFTFSPETCGKDTRVVHLISPLELFFHPTGNDHTSPLKVAGTCSFRSSRICICSQEGSHLSIFSWLGKGISTTTQNLPPQQN